MLFRSYSALSLFYIPDIKKEKELNIRLNKNTGEFDLEKLQKFSEKDLSQIGFNVLEINDIFKNIGLDEQDANMASLDGNVEIVEMKNRTNFLVVTFEDDLSFENAKAKLKMGKAARVISYKEFYKIMVIDNHF